MNNDRSKKILYTISYIIITIITFLISNFLFVSAFKNRGFSKLLMLMFAVTIITSVYTNISQIIKLYNEELGQKMLKKTSIIYNIVFIILWFSFLIYFDYIMIKDYNANSLPLILFSLTFYIPGIILIKKVKEKINDERHL